MKDTKDITGVKSKLRPLTRKQKAFADALLANKKMSATQAVRETYNVKAEGSTARTVAAENMAKPSIQIYMQSHADSAVNRVVQLVKSKREEIALAASKDILDRVHGKPTQRIEQHTTGVTINIDLASTVDTP